MQTAGPERCVIWSTIVRPPYTGVSYDGLNNVLFDAARRWQSFHVFDWRSLAHAHPGWFGTDGVHPSIPGYRLRAKSLAAFIRTTCDVAAGAAEPALLGGGDGGRRLVEIGALDLAGLVGLEDVAFLDVVEALEQDAALEPLASPRGRRP